MLAAITVAIIQGRVCVRRRIAEMSDEAISRYGKANFAAVAKPP
jgi:hypothetical protein